MGETIMCQSCGAEGMQLYCPVCGERKLDASQRSMKALLGHALLEVADVNGKPLKTLKAFFLKPGFLSHEHWLGVRKPYMRPLTLFLLINLVYFLFSPLKDFHSPLSSQQHQLFGDWLMVFINDYLTQSGRTFEEVAAQYDVVTEVVAKSLVIVSVPFVVPFAWMLNPSKRYYLVDHTVFSLHLYGFVLAWPTILNAVMSTLYYLIGHMVDLSLQGWSLVTAAFGPVIVYCIFAQRGMYGSAWWPAIIKGWVLSAGIVFSHAVYRFIQFWIAWWQVT